jgi:Zn-finger domain-containing protein
MTKQIQIRTIGDVREVVLVAIFESTDTLQAALAFALQYDAENDIEDGVYTRKIRAELARRGVQN